MKKIVSLLAAALIAGCAVPGAHINNMLDRGDFVSAYKYGIVRGEKIKDRSAFVASIKNHPSGFSTDKFYRIASTDIGSGYRSESTFVEYARLINMADIDGLITESQFNALRVELIYVIEMEAVSNPGIMKSALLKANLPELGAPTSKLEVFKYKLKSISERQDAKLNEIVPLLISASSLNDEKFLDDLRNIGSWLADKEIAQLNAVGESVSYSAISPLVYFANFYRSQEFSDRLKNFFSKVSFSKANLNSAEMRDFDSEFVRKELASRLIKFKVVIEPDDGAFHEDISKLVLSKNEWVQIDEDSNNILLIKRQRFLENLGNPSNGTEIVPDPGFGTLLFIPKNASVLFDYVNTEYRIDYSVDVTLSSKTGRKNIRGADTLKRTECRNIRYQNVFGGVGSIDWYPNDRVQSFCTSSNGNSFDTLKSRVLDKIATEINNSVLIK